MNISDLFVNPDTNDYFSHVDNCTKWKPTAQA